MSNTYFDFPAGLHLMKGSLAKSSELNILFTAIETGLSAVEDRFKQTLSTQEEIGLFEIPGVDPLDRANFLFGFDDTGAPGLHSMQVFFDAEQNSSANAQAALSLKNEAQASASAASDSKDQAAQSAEQSLASRNESSELSIATGQIRDETQVLYDSISHTTTTTIKLCTGGETEFLATYNPAGITLLTLNGFLLEPTDFGATTGTKITLVSAALADEEYKAITFAGFPGAGEGGGTMDGNAILSALVQTFGSVSNIITAEQGNSDVWLEGGGVSNTLPAISAAVSLVSMPENTSRSITAAQLLANASDVNGDPLSVLNLSASSGVLAVNGNDWEFTPSADFTGTVTFSYQVSDGSGATPTTATLSVTGVSAPIYGATISVTGVGIN